MRSSPGASFPPFAGNVPSNPSPNKRAAGATSNVDVRACLLNEPPYEEGTEPVDSGTERFVERLDRGPASLLLGQRHLALGGSSDPLLEVVRRKLDVANEAGGYSVLLGHQVATQTGFLDWLYERSRRFAVSEHLEVIAQYPWVGVWSSAIDSVWADAFEKSWREVQKVFAETYRPPDPRNRHRLHCTFLYGSVTRSDPDERVPTTRVEYLQRRAIAQALVRRLIPILGPTGTLAVEAFDTNDWFTIDDLIGLVAQMQLDQCHLFSADPALLERPEIAELLARRLLTAHQSSLAVTLTAAHQAGTLELGPPADQGDLQRVVSFAGRPRTVPRDLWVTVTSAAHLLDETALVEPTPVSPDAAYAAFRRFLGGADGRPDWESFARGFAFDREFQSIVLDAVEHAAEHHDLLERPIVVHGATGTGKTTALAAIAYQLAQSRRYPILFVDNRAVAAIDADVVDAFAKWAEDEGSRATVAVWDGMLDLDAYDRLARFFASRGRRVVVLGTAYRVPESVSRRRPELIEAPSDLSPDEIGRLTHFLARFDEHLAHVGRLAAIDSSFLVFLYRLLPPSRAAVRSGVLRELERTERTIVRRASALGVEREPRTALGWALLEAGLLEELKLDADGIGLPGEQFKVVEDLMSLVMVAGQLGLAVPLELLLRAAGRDGHASLVKLLDDVDLVRWIEDPAGNFLLGARSRLEAQLITRARLGTLSAEVEFARRLLVEVSDSDVALAGRAEIDFAIGFVRALGAQGPNPDRYFPEYRTLADALRELREDRGVQNPRLMLQEANLLREWSIKQLRNEALMDETRSSAIKALLEASNVLAVALDLASPDRNRALRDRLNVELAATLATRAQALNAVDSLAEERARLFGEARRVALEARAKDQVSYYPVDVLAWATRDALRAELLDEAQRADSVAEVLSAFDLLDPDELDASQIQRYYERQQELGDLVGEVQIADDAFAALLTAKSGAGVFLRARGMAGPRVLARQFAPEDVDRMTMALEFLARYEDVVRADVRCLNLRLDLWWLLRTGQRPFADERFCLPFDQATWLHAVELLQPLEGLDTSYRDAQVRFLHGVADFHLGDYTAAFDSFAEVERRSIEVRGRRRIIRTYLASNPRGEPVLYRGTISSISRGQRRGEVYVEDLRRRVTFIPSEFGTRDLKRGDNLGEFHIAFNFLGIIADPPSFLRRRQSSR